MDKIIAELRAALQSKIDARKQFIEGIEPANFTEEREAEAKTLTDEIDTMRARLDELVEQDERVKRAAEAAKQTGSIQVNERQNPVYTRENASQVSYFRDLFNARQMGDTEAQSRLVRSQETRALSTTANAGGQFAPPAWLIDEFVALARAARVTADLVQHDDLPAGVSSINLPTIATGTAVGVQSTQNTAVQSTDLTTSSVSSGITTIAGQQQASLQLLQQSGIAFDRVILSDLAADYAVKLDNQVINGSGSSGQLTGILNTASINAQTYTQASPTVMGSGQFYSQFNQAVLAISANRFMPATVAVMHPRRWAWVLNALDTQNRPLVTPHTYPVLNSIGDAASNPVPQGLAGELLGVPVYVDPNIPTNLGAGTNQDPVIIMRASDLWLYETPLSTASFDATYANQLTILFRVHAFSAFIPNRYPKGIAVINGTGLVTPTF